MAMFDAQLPDGWGWEPLDRHYRITKKPSTVDYRLHQGIPFVPMEAVPSRGNPYLRYELRRPEAISSGTYFERGDVLVSKITPSFENGKQGKADDLPSAFGIASTEIIPVQPRGDADGWYLFYYLLHPEVRGLLADKMEGSTGRQRIPQRAISDLLVPMPPALEQARIAATLQTIQRAISVEERLIATTRELKQAVMQELFTSGPRGGEPKETDIGAMPLSWDLVTVGEEMRLVAGGTPARSVREYWEGGTIPWVKTSEVDYSVIVDTEEKITPEGVRNSSASVLPPGTVLLAMYGQGVTRGKVAVLGIEAATNQACVGLLPKNGSLHPLFLYYYLTYSYERIRGLSHGAQQQNLSREIVASIRVPRPHPDEQQDIARILQVIDARESIQTKKRRTLEELFNVLLHELMTGRLRVTDGEATIEREGTAP